MSTIVHLSVAVAFKLLIPTDHVATHLFVCVSNYYWVICSLKHMKKTLNTCLYHTVSVTASQHVVSTWNFPLIS